MVASKGAPQNQRAGDNVPDDGEGTVGVDGCLEGYPNTPEEDPENSG